MVERKPANRCKCAVLGICGVIIATGLFVGIYPAYAHDDAAAVEKFAHSKIERELSANEWKMLAKQN